MTEELPTGEAAQPSTATQDAAATPQPGDTAAAAASAADAKPAQEQASAAQTPPKGDEPAEGTKPAGDTVKPEGAPEKYDFKAPDGTVLEPGVVDKFSTVAKELNLSQEAAQKVVDELAPALASAQREAFTQVVAEWGKAAKADKEIGGEKFDANLGLAKEGLAFLGTPELMQFLDDSGLGHHPEMIRLGFKIGQAIKEDTHVEGSTSPAGKEGRTDTERYAAALYGSKA